MEKLEELAIDFCKDFLKVIHNPKNENVPEIIGLHGAQAEVLLPLKNYMENYFRENNEKIEIVLEKKGYDINVEFFKSQ